MEVHNARPCSSTKTITFTEWSFLFHFDIYTCGDEIAVYSHMQNGYSFLFLRTHVAYYVCAELSSITRRCSKCRTDRISPEKIHDLSYRHWL